MSISNDNVDIIVNPEKVTIELNDDIQSIQVNAESITIQINSLLSSAGSSLVIGETPTGAINGSNATFTTLQNFVPLGIDVVLNSTIQTYGVDYTTSGTNTIILNQSPIIGDIIRVNYKIG